MNRFAETKIKTGSSGRRNYSVDGFSDLLKRIIWYIRLRWFAIGGVFFTTWLVSSPLGIIKQPFPLYAIALLMIVYNSVFYHWSRRLKTAGDVRCHPRSLSRFAVFQAVTDLVVLTVLIHYSGGLENPFMFYFVFHMITASILLSRLTAYLQATLATVLLGSLALLEYFGVLPHVSLMPFVPEGLYRSGMYLLGVMAAFSSTLFLAVFMATSIMSELRKARESLEETNQELEEINRLKSQYVIMVGHELKSPLATIMSILKLINEGYLSGEKQVEMVARALTRSERLLRLINELLDLSHIRTFGPSQGMERRHVCHFLSHMESFLQARAREKNVTLSVRYPCGSEKLVEKCAVCEKVRIMTNKFNMEHLFSNLMSNAIKYTGSGGQVTVELSTSRSSVTARIADTGIGIPREDIPKLYDDFFRSENAKACDPGGTGVGLAIVKQIVKAQGGSIAVESEPGSGTCFTVDLPR